MYKLISSDGVSSLVLLTVRLIFYILKITKSDLYL
jgi:hypothetical protein